MTEAKVRNIVNESIQPVLEALKGFRNISEDTMTTTQVAKFFGKSKDWVRSRRMELGGQRANKRGDYEFKTDRILDYKLNNSKHQL